MGHYYKLLTGYGVTILSKGPREMKCPNTPPIYKDENGSDTDGYH
jgi:hypothetical protein